MPTDESSGRSLLSCAKWRVELRFVAVGTAFLAVTGTVEEQKELSCPRHNDASVLREPSGNKRNIFCWCSGWCLCF